MKVIYTSTELEELLRKAISADLSCAAVTKCDYSIRLVNTLSREISFPLHNLNLEIETHDNSQDN